MMDVIIRPIIQDDADALFALRLTSLKINPEAFGADYADTLHNQTAASYAERIPTVDSDNLMIGAELDGALVGMMGFVRETRPKTKHMGVIWGVFVDPKARGRGISKQMMTAIMTHAQQCDGLRQVVLSVVTDNQAAVKLYQRFGFTIWGTQPDALQVHDQSYAMHWMSYQVASI